MRKICVVFLAAVLSVSCSGQENSRNDQLFGRQQLVEDLNYWFHIAEELHPNLYRYVDKDEFQMKRKSIENQIADSMSRKDFGRLISPLIYSLHHGHTGVLEVQSEFGTYTKSGGLLFPFDIRIIDKRIFVLNNYSENQELMEGTEILAINGISASDLLDTLVQFSRGEREAFRYRMIENEFRFKNWLVFDWGSIYSLNVKLPKGHEKSIKTNGITSLQLSARKIVKDNFKLNLLNNETALLEINTFEIGLKKEYERFIDNSIEEINKLKIRRLVIDLRDNTGGDTRLGDYLLRYISDKPVSQFSKWEVTSTPTVRRILKNDPLPLRILGRKNFYKPLFNSKDGEKITVDWDENIHKFFYRGFFKPQKESKRFTGNVYVLISDMTFSAGTDFCNAIKDYKLGTIVGEETGGLATCATDYRVFSLPNTGLTGFSSYKTSYRPNGKDTGHGIIPDIELKCTPEDIIEKADRVVEYLKTF